VELVYTMFTPRRHSPTVAMMVDVCTGIGWSMTPRRIHLGLSAFVVLSGVVAFNVFFLQGGGRRARVELGPAPEAIRSARADPTRAMPGPHVSDAQSSETTRAIQRELETRGYNIGRSDGTANLVVRAAILAFEIDHGLPLTADPSDAVLQAIVLGSAVAGPTVGERRPAAGPHAEQLIRTVQQSLVTLGVGAVKVDGHLGEETVRAISRFERDQGMAPTGRISGPMVARLAQVAADRAGRVAR
jgi:peptidoglycan hydrolase-like protein with peptidoglycan-binding domain